MTVLHPLLRPTGRRFQAGFTVIELMIALFIGLALSASLVTIVASMRNSFTTQDNLGMLQDTERMAITIINNTVHASGFVVNASQSAANTTALAFPAYTNPGDNSSFATGQTILGLDTGGNSVVYSRYQAATDATGLSGLMNCLGQTNTTANPVVWINQLAVNTATNELTCSVNGAAAVPLVSNVTGMTVSYGVDTQGDNSADSYLAAAAVSAANLWASVKTVRFTLTFSDLLGSGTQPTLTHTVFLMNNSCSVSSICPTH